jgi:uncharacterized protein YfaP (DUF2135 family)
MPSFVRFAVLALLVCTALPAAAREAEGVPIGKGKTKSTVTLNAPTGGWTVDRMILVSGTVSDTTIDPVVLSINGDRYLLRTRNGQFWRKFPAATGKNIVTVRATNLAGTTTAQATTFVQAPPVPLKVILTSDTDGVYTDLHIYEPREKSTDGESLDASSMAHVYWANTESPSGGTFFLNEQGGSAESDGDFDQPGYGPYLYVHRAPPKGVFLVATNYWPSGDKAHTLATLNLSLFEGTPNEIKRTVRVPLATPGTTRVLVWINVVDGSHALVYVPGQDRVPSGNGWPKNLAEAAEKVQKNASGE